MRKTVYSIASMLMVLAAGCEMHPVELAPVSESGEPIVESVSADGGCDPGLGPRDNPCPRTGSSATKIALRLPSGFGRDECREGSDSDADGLSDACEYEVAATFAPALMINWSKTSPRDEYYVVMPGQGVRIMIFYALGYHYDRGDTGFTEHDGDSEFIVMSVIPPTEAGYAWLLDEAYLSAHHLDDRADSSERIGSEEMETDGYGRPLVWVSENKQANYASQDKCNNGGYTQLWMNADDCGENDTLAYFAVYENGNLGQYSRRTYPPCSVPSRHGGMTNRYECYWFYGAFHGWMPPPNSGSGTAYRIHLRHFDFLLPKARMRNPS